MAKLPTDFLVDGLSLVRGGQASRLGGICGGTEGVRAHMWDGRGLTGGSRSCHRCGSAHLASRSAVDETAADLSGNAKLATSEGAQPSDGPTGSAIARSLCFEQPQYPLCAVRCPHGDDSPIGFAQRLRRSARTL